jgi:hypothetical protein
VSRWSVRRTSVLILVTIALAGCDDSSSDGDRTRGSTTTSTSNRVIDGAQVVEPTPGMARVRPVGFDAATPTTGRRSLDVQFTGGVAPCFVLDHVDVDEQAETVTVTLYAGSEPSAKDAACIQIAALYATTVALDAPLAGREIVDGALS